MKLKFKLPVTVLLAMSWAAFAACSSDVANHSNQSAATTTTSASPNTSASDPSGAAAASSSSSSTASSAADIVSAHGGDSGGKSISARANQNSANQQNNANQNAASLEAPQGELPVTVANTQGRMMGTPIDTTKFDKTIARLEPQAMKGNATIKQQLAEAYLARAKALTEAQQYRAALGDYRRTLKYDAKNEYAANMENQILTIFKSLNREAPAPGTEPAPLPFTKQ